MLIFGVLSISRFRLCCLRFKMSCHQANKDKPRSAKCRHFCFSFDTPNYCPTCREFGKGDDPCVITLAKFCGICAAFSEEQLIKITHRKHYVKKQKRDTTKDDELDPDTSLQSLLGLILNKTNLNTIQTPPLL